MDSSLRALHFAQNEGVAWIPRLALAFIRMTVDVDSSASPQNDSERIILTTRRHTDSHCHIEP